ncbi:sensor histidine kinase [Streptomyces aculeolatus]|uniref:sensor histidine kinase n=1 Tax=Streptomyces aculeolatus TaxID=270689 RepID=UPI001CEDB74B|nr:histidine kinase [Streptomyces aculeolatus]
MPTRTDITDDPQAPRGGSGAAEGRPGGRGVLTAGRRRARRAAGGPGPARWSAVAVMAAFAAVYVAAGSPLVLLAFTLQLGQLVPALRQSGPRLVLLLAAQAAACGAAVYATGTSVAVLGFLGGSLLLTPWWPAAVPVAAAAALTGPVDSFISMLLISLVCYGLTRLADLADEVHAARLDLAAAAVGEERLRIAAELSEGLGRGLAGITMGVRAALDRPERSAELLAEVAGAARDCLADARGSADRFRAMALAPEMTSARALLAAAGVATEVRTGHSEPLGSAGALLGGVLREAVTALISRGTATHCLIETGCEPGRVWLAVVSDDTTTAEEDVLGGLPERIAAAGGSLTTALTPEGRREVRAVLPDAGRPAAPDGDSLRWAYRLSLAVLAAVLAGFSLKALLLVSGHQVLPAAALLAVVVTLHLRSVHGRHPVHLALMALLTYLPMAEFGRGWLGTAGFLAGPVLLALPWAVAWPVVGAVMGSVAVIGVQLRLSPALTVNYTLSTMVTGLVIHGLLRLPGIVRELQAAQRRLARAAVVEERLRAARDLHDLLGHSLAAILLTCELTRRLPPERARGELRNILVMAERGEADLRSAAGGVGRMPLDTEAGSARSVLAAAGIDTGVSLAHDGLPAGTETALSAVLREAVTNVLRHSDARTAEISTAAEAGGVRLRVRNDGVRGTGGRRDSSGLGNLTTRLAALDGTLTAGAGDGWFELSAWVPGRS